MTDSGLISRVGLLVIAAVAGAVAYAGLELCRFDVEVRRLEAATAVPAPAERRQWVGEAIPAAEAGAILERWSATPGVSTAALSTIASHPQADETGAQRLLKITSALTHSPTTGRLWLSYADETLRLGYGQGNALGALDMAAITERREASGMLSRALFVLSTWEAMPADRRDAVLADIAELKWTLPATERKAIAVTVARKPPAVRVEISDALASKLRGDRIFLKALGL